MIQLQNQQFTNKTLHERECSTELLVYSKGVLKNCSQKKKGVRKFHWKTPVPSKM